MKSSNGSASKMAPHSLDRANRHHHHHHHQSSSLATQLRQASIAKPDLKQMTTFKPSTSYGVGMNCIPGGGFPLPSALSNLLTKLPPPNCFHVSRIEGMVVVHI